MRSRRSGKGVSSSGSTVRAFHMVNAMNKKGKSHSKGAKASKHSSLKQLVQPKEDSKPMTKVESSKQSKAKATHKGLMFVDIKLNGKPLHALVDTSATHNVVVGTEVERLGLSL